MERNGKGIFRESYTVGQGQAKPKGYTITENCISCGACVEHCPVAAVIPREQETVPPET